VSEDPAAARGYYEDALGIARDITANAPDDRMGLLLLGYSLQKLSSLIEDKDPEEWVKLDKELSEVIRRLEK
ncbi:hypothetical protein M0E87_12335, partial [Corynebacterium sp. CCM 9185]